MTCLSLLSNPSAPSQDSMKNPWLISVEVSVLSERARNLLCWFPRNTSCTFMVTLRGATFYNDWGSKIWHVLWCRKNIFGKWTFPQCKRDPCGLLSINTTSKLRRNMVSAREQDSAGCDLVLTTRHRSAFNQLQVQRKWCLDAGSC